MAMINKGVIVEFDFTVLNGAEILFETAKNLLKGVGVELDAHLARSLVRYLSPVPWHFQKCL